MNKGTLAWRFFRKNWRVQLAVTLLFAVSVTLLILYGTYLERESHLMMLRMSDTFPHNFVLVTVPKLQGEASPLRPHHGAGPVPAVYVGSWRNEILSTNFGRLPAVAWVDDLNLGMAPGQNEVLISANMAREFGLTIGDTVLINGENFDEYRVAAIHDGQLVGDRLVRTATLRGGANAFLYQAQTQLPAVVSYLQRSYPEGSFEHAESVGSTARKIVDAIYSPGRKASAEAVMFITLAFLTVTLFGFLEKRKVLAVVKALGLKTLELVSIIAGEGALPPLFGSMLGCLTGFALLKWLIGAGQEFVISPAVFLRAVLSIWPAVLIGIAIPSRYVQVATVNQLLFERPVPMQTVQITELRKFSPGLDPFIAKGVRFIKLVMDKGHFSGFIFRGYGDYVKQGEILAVGVNWWGLQVVEYISPLTGQIVVFQEEIGLIGVSPEEGPEYKWQPSSGSWAKITRG